MPKPSDGDRARFRSLVPEHGAVEVKPMFGNLGASVNDQSKTRGGWACDPS